MIIVYIMLWGLFGWASAAALERSNQGGTGCLLGLLLGPLGLAIALVMRSNATARNADRRRHDEQLRAHPPAPARVIRNERECPFCAELILVKARVCKHCGRDLATVAGA